MDCVIIYIYHSIKVNYYPSLGIFILCFIVQSSVAQNSNNQQANAVQLEPTLSPRDQFIIIGCVTGFTLGLLITLIIGCFMKCRHRPSKSFPDKDYKSLDKISPHDFNNGPQSMDRKLAKSAQMYHYQLSKQNLIELEKAENNDQEKEKASDESDSNDECTVYECSGLGKMQNMEIRNPLFSESISTIDNSVVSSKDPHNILPK